jgi:hypothetical protein
MPSVPELSALYENVMLGPRRGPDVCARCFNFTAGYQVCYACAHSQPVLDAMAPISYSVAGEQLNHALASYKRLNGDVATRLGAILAAVLWRFLAGHEPCLARAAGVRRFDLVTTVPSGDHSREERHPLPWVVGELVGPTRDRYEQLLVRSEVPVPRRGFSPDKFRATRPVGGSVLLVDDTWTTGSSAQSAAAALRNAGAERTAAVVIGRHLNREWHENDRRLRGIAQPFDWTACALCAETAAVCRPV